MQRIELLPCPMADYRNQSNAIDREKKKTKWLLLLLDIVLSLFFVYHYAHKYNNHRL